MRDVRRLFVILATTVALLYALIVVDPFHGARLLIISLFQAGPESAKVERYFVDATTQETTHGADPLTSFEQLRGLWPKGEGISRTYLIGNSQMYYMILSPAETPTDASEKTYPDFTFEYERRHDSGRRLFYRLAAPNISYMEALWYVSYLLSVPELRPTTLIVQLNYETFRKSGVRDGMLSMLDNPGFRESIRRATTNPAYGSVFEQALERYARLQCRNGGGGTTTESAQLTHTGMNEAIGPGTRLENGLRHALADAPGFAKRHELKLSMLDVLYLLRVHVLRIKPTTPRPIGGATLQQNEASLAAIARLCSENKIELKLFNAPQNPLSPLYNSERNRQLYQETIHRIAKSNAAPIYDFEASIPAEYWGVWIDGPDPIHFGRRAHQMMANLVVQSGMTHRN